jgi:hypothetical protein
MNHVVNHMKKHGIPVTRENYLDFAYLGNPPEELGPEEEAELPEEIKSDQDEGRGPNTVIEPETY